MAKKVEQVRYYGPHQTELPKGSAAGRGANNWPATLTHRSMTSGTAFAPKGVNRSVVQLGIQSLPGTKFFINNSGNPVVIGATGIYELNVDGLAKITNLSFEPESVNRIDNSSTGYILVDYVYEEGE